MIENKITLRQLMEVFRGELAWMRIYPNSQQTECESYMGRMEIQRAVSIYGDKTAWRVYPGYGFIMVYLDR